MKQEKVIALAAQVRAGWPVAYRTEDDTNGVSVWLFKKTAVKYQDPPDALYTADQVASAVLREREECAKVCDEVGGRVSGSHAWDAAAAIRARGDKT